jgi:hypothetical protein
MSVCIVKGRHFVGFDTGCFHGKINTKVVYPDFAHGGRHFAVFDTG